MAFDQAGVNPSDSRDVRRGYRIGVEVALDLSLLFETFIGDGAVARKQNWM